MKPKKEANSRNNSIPDYIITYSVLVAIFFLVFIVNKKIYFMMDDAWYWTNLVTGNPISSISDIIESQIWHYNNWGGRSIAHGLLQLLLWSGDFSCNVLNTLALALLGFFLTRFSGKMNKWNYLLGISLVIAFNTNIRDTLFWQSGCVNYLYMSLIYIPFTCMYLHTLNDITIQNTKSSTIASDSAKTNNPIINYLLALVYIVWGLLAGWTNENIGPTIALLSIVVIIILIKNKKRVHIWMISGAIGSILGSAMMILAPGNQIRNKEVIDYGNWKLNLCHRVVDYLKPSYEWLLPIILITVFSFTLYVLVLKKLPDIVTLLIIASGIVSYGALILSPHIPERCMFGILCFLSWGCIRMLSEVFDVTKAHKFRVFTTLLCSYIAFMKLFYLFAIMAGWYL